MAFLDEVSPRGWSMKFGHRRRLVAAAHGAADKKCGRSTVKRSVNRGRRLDDAWEDKNKSHRYQALLRNEIVAELADRALDTFEDAVDVAVVCDVCDVTYVSSLADWEKASVGSASTADTWDQDPAVITAWERAEKRAAVAAKRYQAASEERAKAERLQRRAEKKIDPEVQRLAQSLHEDFRIHLRCPELASHQINAFEGFRMKFLKDFGTSIGHALQSCYRGEVDLRCAPMSHALQSRFLSYKEKQPHQLCAVTHGTDDRNLPSIYHKGLLVPTGSNNVKVLNGLSHGKGIYTAKTHNTALSFGFSKGISRPLLICGALDDAKSLPAPVRCGNHYITAESARVRHVGDAIVVFDETKLLPLFVASYSGIAPPLQPGTGTAPVRAPAQAPATRTSVVVSAKTTMAQVGADGKKPSKICDGPMTRLTTLEKRSPNQLIIAFLSRRGARKRRP